MFTLKFYKLVEGGYSVDFVSCSSFNVYERDNATFEVVTYERPTRDEGVSRNIGPGRYDHCYIENAGGKTIAHYVAPRDLEGD